MFGIATGLNDVWWWRFSVAFASELPDRAYHVFHVKPRAYTARSDEFLVWVLWRVAWSRESEPRFAPAPRVTAVGRHGPRVWGIRVRSRRQRPGSCFLPPSCMRLATTGGTSTSREASTRCCSLRSVKANRRSSPRQPLDLVRRCETVRNHDVSRETPGTSLPRSADWTVRHGLLAAESCSAYRGSKTGMCRSCARRTLQEVAGLRADAVSGTVPREHGCGMRTKARAATCIGAGPSSRCRDWLTANNSPTTGRSVRTSAENEVLPREGSATRMTWNRPRLRFHSRLDCVIHPLGTG